MLTQNHNSGERYRWLELEAVIHYFRQWALLFLCYVESTEPFSDRKLTCLICLFMATRLYWPLLWNHSLYHDRCLRVRIAL